MNPEIKAAWVAALRSGEYTQGRGSLRDYTDAYCCLGVLCDMGVKAGVAQWALLRPTHYTCKTATFNADCDLPQKIADWAGLPTGGDVYAGGVGLIHMNDGVRASFAEIADRIEQYL